MVKQKMKQVTFITDVENAEFYVASLAIGILKGMKDDSVPFEVAIWSLARPCFWLAFEQQSILSNDLLKCIQTFDEIDGLTDENARLKIVNELLSQLKQCQRVAVGNQMSLKMVTRCH